MDVLIKIGVTAIVVFYIMLSGLTLCFILMKVLRIERCEGKIQYNHGKDHSSDNLVIDPKAAIIREWQEKTKGFEQLAKKDPSDEHTFDKYMRLAGLCRKCIKDVERHF